MLPPLGGIASKLQGLVNRVRADISSPGYKLTACSGPVLPLCLLSCFPLAYYPFPISLHSYILYYPRQGLAFALANPSAWNSSLQRAVWLSPSPPLGICLDALISLFKVTPPHHRCAKRTPNDCKSGWMLWRKRTGAVKRRNQGNATLVKI